MIFLNSIKLACSLYFKLLKNTKVIKKKQSTLSMAKNFTINACILIQNVLIIQVDHQLFAMAKLDVLGDSREEVIVCAWDGQTYILDHDRNVVRYHFHKNVQVGI